jgi:DNA-binding beta-propeller fold protein YncE
MLSNLFSRMRGIFWVVGVIFLACAGAEMANAQIIATPKAIYVIAGGNRADAQFNNPTAIIKQGLELLVVDSKNHAIRKISETGFVTPFAGLVGQSGPPSIEGRGSRVRFFNPVAIDAANGVFYIADRNNHIIRTSTPSGLVEILAGSGISGYADGPLATAQFRYPSGVAVDRAGNVFVADTGNNVIRKITPAGQVTTFAGKPSTPGRAGSTCSLQNGFGSNASFCGPTSIVADQFRDGSLYVVDTNNSAIRKITPDGLVTRFAGGVPEGSQAVDYCLYLDRTGIQAKFCHPEGIAIDQATGNLYVADSGNNVIRQITQDGVVTTVAGNKDCETFTRSCSNPSYGFPSGLPGEMTKPVGITVIGPNKLAVTVTKVTSLDPDRANAILGINF